jgi:hypothetical protein
MVCLRRDIYRNFPFQTLMANSRNLLALRDRCVMQRMSAAYKRQFEKPDPVAAIKLCHAAVS